MFHENEIVMLLICVGVLFFIFLQRKNIAKFRGWSLLLASFILLLIACISTIVEGFVLEIFFNYLEHSCYALSGILLAAWCYMVFQGKSEQ